MMPKDTCYNCKQMRHFAQNCKVKNKTKNTITSIEEIQKENSTNKKEELSYIKDNYEKLIKFNEKIDGNSIWIFLDSKSLRNFINKTFVRQHCLTSEKIKLFEVELANRTRKDILQTVII